METLRNYIDTMFSTWPDNEATRRVKRQLSELMEDKYTGLIDEGVSANEALGQVISEFGNTEELRRELGIELPQEIDADEIPARELAQRRERERAARKMVRGNYWIFVTVIYFVLSFLTGWWHLSWLLFVLAVPAESFINYLLRQSDQSAGDLE